VKKFIVMMGPPGGGKGTQARILSRKLGVPHLSTGELFRTAIKEGTDLGGQIEDIMEQGGLVSDELAIAIIKEEFSSDACDGGFIFDGFPRTLEQAKSFDAMLTEFDLKLDVVIDIQVPDSYILERIVGRYTCAKCGEGYHDKFKPPAVPGVCDACGGSQFVHRADDNAETVNRRLMQYRAMTMPVLPYYESKGLLVLVDGTGSIDSVAGSIASVVME
jgi:adenylate kinase